MNCDDIDNGLYVYLDDEFADLERAHFEAHVQACPRCRALVARDGRMIQAVRESAPRSSAPEGLRARVLAALDAAPTPLPREAPAKAPRTFPTWIASGIALAAAALLVAFAMGGTGSADTERVANESVAAHQTNLPMEVRGSEHQIRSFLQDNVPFPVEVPLGEDPRVRLTGARLTRVDGRDAILFSYEIQGERLSVVQVAAQPGEASPDAEPSLQHHQGFDVVTYRRRGITSSVVSSGQNPNVGRLIQAAWQR